MNISELPEIFELARLSRDTVLVNGHHGIGKSTVVQDFCLKNNFFLVELFLSNQEVGDLIGSPIEKDGTLFWSVPSWLTRMREASERGQHCVLHLDELNRAEPDVRQAALQLVLEGKIHEHELPILDGQKTFIIASINPSDDIYDVYELDPALIDRFLYIEAKVSLDSFIEYATSKFDIPEYVIKFLKENSEFLWYMPEETPNSNTRIGASPRSWLKLCQYFMNSSFWKIPDKLQLEIITGKVGIPAGNELLSYIQKPGVCTEEVIEFIRREMSENSNIPDVAPKVERFIGGTDILRVNTIAHNLVQKSVKDNSISVILLIFLYGIKMELLVGVLKEIKTNQINLFNSLVSLDSEFNNKNLFRKITK